MLVSTAAHCVWTTRSQSAATSIKILWTDADGNKRTTNAKRFFYPKRFPQLYQTFPKMADEFQSIAGKGAVSEFTRSDIALIIPEERILTLGYANWITDILKKGDVYYEMVDAADNDPSKIVWTDAFKARMLKSLSETFGDVTKARAMIVGFGQFCPVDGPDCGVADGKRRYGETSVVRPMVQDPDFDVPWIWRTGTNEAGLNPMRHGDSGGATFIQALDGRWFFVGYNSNSNGLQGSSSSLLANLDTFGAARMDTENMPIEPAAEEGANPIALYSPNWPVEQAKSFIKDMLAAWSAPNPTALRLLSSLYEGVTTYYENDQANVEDAIADKTKFFEHWPSRSFEPIPGRMEATCDVRWKVANCIVKALVKWQYKGADPQYQASGVTKYEINTSLSQLLSLDFDQISPPSINGESGEIISMQGVSEMRTEIGRIDGMCGPPSGDYVVIDPDPARDRTGIGSVEIFEAAASTAKPLASLPENAVGVDASECGAGWCKVRYGCHLGWAEQKYLARKRDVTYSVTGVRPDDPDGLNIHQGGTGGEVVRSIPFNAKNVVVHVCPTNKD